MSEALKRDKSYGVGGAILRGANAKWFGRDKITDNPFPDMPGYFVLRRAWEYGFKNSDAVIREADGEDD